jgi:glycosyltransferase involved in cell wall biosynthesis
VVAPRGELHPGALAIRRWKKAPFLRLARAVRLVEGVVWHATADEEAAQIRRWFGARAEVAVAPVLATPSGAEPLERAPKRPGHLEVAFLSRVSEKKNLLGAIDLLSGVAGSIRLNVYGPKEDAAYWQRCQDASASLPPGIRMCDRGEVPAHEVRRALARNHVLLLPTWGENFGHVILESLLAGVPVLISDQTPWRDLEGRGAGWDLPLAEPDGFRSRLRSLVEMDGDELARWSRGAERLGHAYARDPGTMSRSRDLLVGTRCA